MGHEKQHTTTGAKQQTSAKSQTDDFEKGEKARGNSLRRPAGAGETPLSPDPSTSNIRTSHSSLSALSSFNDECLPPLGRSMIKRPHRVIETGSHDMSEDEETTPGAVRVSFALTPPSPIAETASVDNEDNDEEISLGAEFTSPPDVSLPLAAEAVSVDDESERIRELREHNEALQKRMQQALENEERARKEVQEIASAPAADVTVIMGDADFSEFHHPPAAVVVAKAHHSKKRKTFILMMGCIIFCLTIIVVATLVGMNGAKETIIINADDSALKIQLRTDYLKGLLTDLEPLNEQAFHYLTEFDEWKPEDTPEDYVEGEGAPGKSDRDRMWFERYALAVLYYSTDGDVSWESTFGWLSPIDHHCSTRMDKWMGVWCENDRVIYIELANNAMIGTIPPEIKLLQNLGYLSLGGQALLGTIPTRTSSQLELP